MFEKEAFKWTEKNISAGISMYNPSIEMYCGKAFKDGAEFGFNRAIEEWKKHFMQCSSPFCLDKFSEVKCYGELGNMAKKEGEEK